MDQAELQALFGGAPGTPVPQVDPEDVKAVWMLSQDTKKDHPTGQNLFIGVEVFERTCKPGANIKAVFYRATKIEILRSVTPAVMEPLLRDKSDAVFRAAAEIPMEWIGVGIVHHGWVFDLDDFVRPVNEAA